MPYSVFGVQRFLQTALQSLHETDARSPRFAMFENRYFTGFLRGRADRLTQHWGCSFDPLSPMPTTLGCRGISCICA
jgi:hypothetical protein